MGYKKQSILFWTDMWYGVLSIKITYNTSNLNFTNTLITDGGVRASWPLGCIDSCTNMLKYQLLYGMKDTHYSPFTTKLITY